MTDFIGVTVDPITLKIRPTELPIGTDIAGLDVDGDVIDAQGNKVTGSVGENGHLAGQWTADAPVAEAAGDQVVTAAWVRSTKMTIDTVPAGYMWPVRCPGGVQPLRSTVTLRTDIGIRWEMPDPPSFAAGYAIAGLDGWRRRLWPA